MRLFQVAHGFGPVGEDIGKKRLATRRSRLSGLARPLEGNLEIWIGGRVLIEDIFGRKAAVSSFEVRHPDDAIDAKRGQHQLRIGEAMLCGSLQPAASFYPAGGNAAPCEISLRDAKLGLWNSRLGGAGEELKCIHCLAGFAQADCFTQRGLGTSKRGDFAQQGHWHSILIWLRLRFPFGITAPAYPHAQRATAIRRGT